jgi:hypothetical protein
MLATRHRPLSELPSTATPRDGIVNARQTDLPSMYFTANDVSPCTSTTILPLGETTPADALLQTKDAVQKNKTLNNAS